MRITLWSIQARCAEGADGKLALRHCSRCLCWPIFVYADSMSCIVCLVLSIPFSPHGRKLAKYLDNTQDSV